MAEGLAQAYFEILDGANKGTKIKVQYNPTQFTTSKGAQIAEIAIPGIDSPVLQFVRGQNEKVSLELFFDSTKDGMDGSAKSVTEMTNPFYALVKMSGNQHAPTRCRFGWGTEFPGLINNEGDISAKRKSFDCIVESVEQRFTLFNPEGVPLRAILTLQLREYKSLKTQLEQLNLRTADHTRIHTVQEGENLPQVAYQAYGDAAKWRLIARENNLLDPRKIYPGMTLVLPQLRT